MAHINILIDNYNVSIGDTPTEHNFTQHFIDKLEKDGALTEIESVGFGKNIFDNIFSTEDRRKLIDGHLQALSPTDLLIINILICAINAVLFYKDNILATKTVSQKNNISPKLNSFHSN
ncbi:MAG: hypothetical protein L3V56_08725, partial [Candidatus Magnetoovum sp. WYHC-5]|nr:hypothetical protein [Candidatus Magnetoovum sp. WYHC-5]